MIPYKAGDRVIIRDGSEADGDRGAIWDFTGGLILVALDGYDCLWPVEAYEIEPEPEAAERAPGV